MLLDAFIPFNMESILSFVNATEPTHNMSIILTRLLDLLQFAAHSNDCVGRPNASNIIDPTSCNHFIMCTNARSVRKRCPDNLLYDPEKNACEFADNVKCVNGARPTTMTTKLNVFNNATTISPHSTVSINTATVTVEIPPNICNGLETGQDVVDPKSCIHFYICVHTRPVRKACPPTLVYNREARVCDFPKNVHCKNGKRPNVTSTTAAPISLSTPIQSTKFAINFFTICQNATDNPSSTGVGNTGFVPHPGSCIIFFRCLDGAVVERRQCVDGKFFNREQRQCITGGPDSCR